MRRAKTCAVGTETSGDMMPLCAAAAIAWGYVVDYPALKLDNAQLDQQLRHMEDHLRRSIPVYGKDPGKARVLKRDLYQTIKRLRPALRRLEWWTLQQKKREELRGAEVRSTEFTMRRAAGLAVGAGRVLHLAR
jgi:hypothetical protein